LTPRSSDCHNRRRLAAISIMIDVVSVLIKRVECKCLDAKAAPI
jgi:hypothetical protein